MVTFSTPSQPKKCAKTKKYELVCKTAAKQQESNVCAVKAVAMAGRVSYNDAHKACQLHGRRNGKGMYRDDIHSTFTSLGFELLEVKDLYQKNGSKYTPTTIGTRLKTGYFIAYVNGHVFPVINGTVFDWTSGRRHRVTTAYKVIRPRT